MKKLRYIIGLVLVLVAGVSFADPYHFNYTNSLFCNGADGKPVLCDISVQMLGQVFGQVGSGTDVGSLAGNGMLALGWMFRVFNEGVCGVIGLFLAYGIFSFGLRSAHDGLQGESKKASLALLRVVLGVSLILPQATGYSYMQRIVMETIVAGSGLATTIYQQVLVNMKNGAAELYHKVSTGVSSSGSAALNSTNIKTILGSQAKSFIANVFEGEVCTAASNMYVQQMSGYLAFAQSQAASFMTTYTTVCGDKPTCSEPALVQGNLAYAKYCHANGHCRAPASPADAANKQAKLVNYFNTSFPQSLGFQSASSAPSTFSVQDNLESSKDAGVNFPGYTFNNYKANYDPKQNSAVCGSFQAPASSGGTNYKIDPLREIIEGLQPLADQFVQKVLSSKLNNVDKYRSVFASPSTTPGALLPALQLDEIAHKTDLQKAINDMKSQVTSTAINLAQLMMPSLQQEAMAGQSNKANDLKSFVEQATNAGWVTAGRYYFDMIRLNDFIQSVAGPAIKGSIIAPSVTIHLNEINRESGLDILAVASSVVSVEDHGPSSTDNGPLSSTALSSQLGAADAGATPTGSSTDSEDVKNAKGVIVSQWGRHTSLKGKFSAGFAAVYAPAGIGYLMMKPFISAMGNIADFFDNVQTTNPVLFVHKLGMVILGQTLYALMVTNGIIFGTSLVANVCDSESPLGQATNMSINWVGGMVKVMVGPLLMAGGVCAYFVPLYPMLVFTFGVIGWLGAAIEAMIAMPLVCLGLTHPDGQDFTGKSEQAVMLLLGVFIRPAVMIFGMVAAMSVSYVAIRLLNIGFMGVLVDGFGTGMTYNTNGTLHNAMAISNATASMFDHMAFTKHIHDVKIDNDAIAGATGGVQAIGHAIAAAVNGAGNENIKGGSFNTNSMLSMVSIPCLFIVYALMVYEVITMSFGLISEFVQAVLGWIGGPQMRDNSVQQAKGMQSGFTQTSEKIGGTMDEKIGRGGASSTTGAIGEAGKMPEHAQKMGEFFGVGGGS